MQPMKKTKRVKRTRKIHSKRRTQYGGNYNYDIDMSTNNEFMFITMKTAPKIIYKIDLPSQIFSKYRLESDEHPLKHKQDRTLFEILYKERLNNPEVRNILSHYKINNLLLREVVFPSSRRFARTTSPDKKNIKLGRFDKELSPITEEDYVSPQPSPELSALPLSLSPVPVLDTANKSKNSKNSNPKQERLVKVISLPESRKTKKSTSFRVPKSMQQNSYRSLRGINKLP